MEFAWSAAQQALAAELDALFERHPAPDRLRGFADAGVVAFDGELWRPAQESLHVQAGSASPGPARRICTCAGRARWRRRSVAPRPGGYG